MRGTGKYVIAFTANEVDVVIALGILNHSNELTALKAGGVPLKLIIKPLLFGSVLFTMLFVAAAQWLLPTTVARTNNIWFEQLKGKVPLGIMRNNRYYYKGKNGFYSFGWPDPKQYTFKDFSYSRWDEKSNIETLTTAAYASSNIARKWKMPVLSGIRNVN